MTLDARAIAETVYELERRLNLDDSRWYLNGLHLWPMYRMEIYRQLFNTAADSNNRSSRFSWKLLLSPVHRPRTQVKDSPIWLVSDGISFSKIGNIEIERFCTSLAIACSKLDLRGLLVDRGSPAPRRLGDAAAQWWTPDVYRAKVKGTILARLIPDRRHDHLCAMVSQAADYLPCNLSDLPVRRMDAMCRAMAILVALFARRMRVERPQAVFIVGYYDVSGFAMSAAAALVGIPSVDVQHGITGALHPGYANWQKIPAAGYHLLPSWFWAWSDLDAKCVELWAESTNGAHAAINAGHPFMDTWRQGGFQLDTAMATQLNQLKQRSEGRTVVLVTLQPQLTQGEAIAPLLDAIAARPDIAWWLRLHPLALTDKTIVEEELIRRGIHCWDVENSTTLPLPILLLNANWHFTHSSSSVIEAAMVGLPSAVWSLYGAQLFEDEINNGFAYAALNGTALTELLSVTRAAPGAEIKISDRTCAAIHTILISAS